MEDREADVVKVASLHDKEDLCEPSSSTHSEEPTSNETNRSVTTGSVHAFFADKVLAYGIKKPQRRGSMAGTGNEVCESLPHDTKDKATNACSRNLSTTPAEPTEPCGRSGISRGVVPTQSISLAAVFISSISAPTISHSQCSSSTFLNDSCLEPTFEDSDKNDITPGDTGELSNKPQRRMSLVSQLTESYHTLPEDDSGTEHTMESPRRPNIGRMGSQISELTRSTSCFSFEEMDQWSRDSPGRRYGKSVHLISSISELGVSLVSDEGGMENFFRDSIETSCKNFMPKRRASLDMNYNGKRPELAVQKAVRGCASPKMPRRRGSLGMNFTVKGKASAPRIPRRRASLDMTKNVSC